LTEAETRYLIYEWNATERAYALQRCVHELFEEQVGRSEQAVAVEWNGEEVSYGELNRRSNRLAHYLAKRGIGPGSKVGVLLRHSVEMVVGVLGIVKAGGAYVPLDAEHPGKRVRSVLEDAQAEMLLTERDLEPGVGGL
jgi:non-ribosomal peptide synthetase component F